ncbi:TolC family protein [Spirosoma montaniterrae]|uniref:Transporter n=1 Tax=Spirosoma montaniterrae TaxID=1178516 RepID=A0A1P9WZG6_9BACT|nr:TolC family protein [Spirosoma montaniterrae]AQG80770.1 hypothetical protein AWR27_16455 [Spirosoma montaniterrae]
MVSFGKSAGLSNDTLYLDVNQDIAVQLLPFDDLMKLAIAYSPFIRSQNETTSSLEAAYAMTKAQLLQNVSGFANYSGGNQSIVAVGDPNTNLNQNPLGQFSNGYRAGVSASISLFDLFGRKHVVRQAYHNHRAAIAQKDLAELMLRRELIVLYQDMITSQQILKVRIMEEQASLTALRLAEAENQKGRGTLETLASATSRYYQSKASSEEGKGTFLKNIHTFEAMLGVPIQRLKRY